VKTSGTPLPSVRILLVDDSTVFRSALRKLLEIEPGWIVCAEAVNGEEAVEKTRAQHPDVVIMDVAMAMLNNLDAARRLAELAPSIPVLMISNYDLRYLFAEKKFSNVRGYLLKPELADTIVEAVRSAVGGSSLET
jgi:DNA-binding NarL/FixJ family response regulator